ncbi:MAG: LysM peptidoglycan-binding domain-containing protein [Eubacterium sp.]|nr:LysM peptidoglycan-binding domain-containing protein [Eubacterium sp.]
MASKYQMDMAFNGEKEKLHFSVLPTEININHGGTNKSVDVQGLGEIIIKQNPSATVISFSSYFPAMPFPGMGRHFEKVTDPYYIVGKIVEWKNSELPVHFIITGTAINMMCVIDSFSYSEKGGDIGTLYYSITLKEYKEVSIRHKPAKEGSVDIPKSTPKRPDNRVHEKTYTVVKGDCLTAIAARLLGSANRYTEIVSLNSDLIKNPDLIYPGWVLKLPT